MKTICVGILLSIGIVTPSSAVIKHSQGGFIDFNVYPYLSKVKSDSIVTVNMGIKLPHRLSYFSLINFSNQGDSYKAGDTNGYYTEQNLRWQILADYPVDLTAQINLRGGEDNDRYRLGLRWRLNNTQSLASFFSAAHINYSLNFHLIQIDDDDAHVWQIEHVFGMKFPYISDRLYLAGFVDHTFNETLDDSKPSSPVVAEVQLGYRLIDNFYLTSEYRWNEYRTGAVNNVSFGLQYKILW